MILTVTLNPAVDEEFVLAEYRPGRWTQATTSRRSPGGSGINVAIMLDQLGFETVAMGFLAGSNGDYVRDWLRRRRVTTHFLTLEGETRTNINIIDQSRGVETCLLQPGPAADEGALEAFLAAYRRMLCRCSAVVIGGLLPPGSPQDFYRNLSAIAADEGLPVYLNVEGEAEQLAMQTAPAFFNLTPRHLLGAKGDELSLDECKTRVQRALALGVKWAVSSCEGRGEVFGSPAGVILAEAPGGTPARSLFTFDDAITAGLVAGTLEGRSPDDVIRFSMACALEDSGHDLKGIGSRQAVEDLAAAVVLTRLD